MDIVEAINEWIDLEIDDLTDDELEDVLGLLDVIDASDLGGLPAEDLTDAEFDSLIDLFVDARDARDAERLLDDALAMVAAAADGDPADDSPAITPERDDLDGHAELQADPKPGPDAESAGPDTSTLGEATPDVETTIILTKTERGNYDPIADIEWDLARESDMVDVAGTSYADAADIEWDRPKPRDEPPLHQPWLDQPTRALPLIDLANEELGPAFLGSDEKLRGRPSMRRVGLAVGALACLGFFVFGAIRLVDNLEIDPVEVAAETDVESEPEATVAPEPTPEPSAVPPTAVPTSIVSQAAPPVTEPFVGARVAVIDEDGALYLFEPDSDDPDRLREIHLPAPNVPKAVGVTSHGNLLSYLLRDGRIEVVDLDDPDLEPEIIWDNSEDGIPAARAHAASEGRLGVIQRNGSMRLLRTDDGEGRESQVKWQKAVTEVNASTISTTSDGFALLVETGDAVHVTGDFDDTEPVVIWDAEESGRRVELLAANGELIMMILDDGSFAVHDLDNGETEVVWETSSEEFERAAVVTAGRVDERFALALVTGDILLWDPETPNVADFVWSATAEALPVARDVDSAGKDLVFRIEGGTVVHVNLRESESDSPRTSIWDVSSGARVPAEIFSLLPATGG